MTSRVQKGGPIFRPVVKSRTRPEANQTPHLTDLTESPAITQHTPSSSVPTHLSEPPSLLPTDQHPVPTPVIPSTAVQIPRIPPSIPCAPPPILSMRNTPAPPTLGTSSRATPVPPIARHPPSSSSVIPLPAPNRNSAAAVPQPTVASPEITAESSSHNVLKMTLNTDMKIKPPRTSSRKKPIASSSTSISALDAPQTPEDSTPHEPTKKSRTDSTVRKTTGKRKKKTVSSSDDRTDDESQFTTAKRRRRASSTPRPRRSRAPSIPPYDPNADPGEEIDPTVVTMASLCNDTGQGRVSSKAAEILSNHAAWKIQNREKRARMKALMELKKYGREEEVDELEASVTSPGDKLSEAPEPVVTAASAPAISDDTGSGFDYTQDLATSRFNVQVRIGPNGETVIDEESLVVDRIEVEDTTNYTHVVESDHTKFVNSGSYGKRYRGSRWSAEETELFFDALAQYGENYELIAYVLPGRDRKSCKNKFKAEDKKNPARINHCLNNNIPVDMATLSRMTGKDFSGPVPEIRLPTPQPVVESGDAEAEQPAPRPEPVRKRPIKKKGGDDGVMIVGDAESFVPFPDSP